MRERERERECMCVEGEQVCAVLYTLRENEGGRGGGGACMTMEGRLHISAIRIYV